MVIGLHAHEEEVKAKGKTLKTYTLDQIKDELIGKCGTTDRDQYEFALRLDLEHAARTKKNTTPEILTIPHSHNVTTPSATETF